MENKPKLVVASNNAGKLREISAMLPEFTVVGYRDCGCDFEIDETGSTFYENALIKAKTVSEFLNLPALADDSGLCIDALFGAPGIYSARFSADGDDEHNNDLVLEKMQDIAERDAKFVSCMVMYYPNGKVITATGETKGRILKAREGKNGFGYDPIFFSYDLNKSMGIATDKEKNSVSHRYRALMGIKEKLSEIKYKL